MTMSQFARRMALCMVAAVIGGTSLVQACVSSDAAERQSFIAKLRDRPAGKTVVEPALRFEAMPVQVGQYVHYLISLPGAATASGDAVDSDLISYRQLVSRAGSVPYSFWLEEEIVRADAEVRLRSLIVMDDSRLAVANREPDSFKPLIADFSRVMRVQGLDSEGLNAVNVPVARTDMLPGLNIKISLLSSLKTAKAKALTVRAGQFKGCIEATSRVLMNDETGQLTSCLSPSVPLNGIVEARDPLGRKWELVEFGAAGLESHFPPGDPGESR